MNISIAKATNPESGAAASNLATGRYLLYIDILGFAKLVESESPEHVYRVIETALGAFARWEELNGQFRTIYFSDTILFYQKSPGYAGAWFLDVYAIGGMLLSALLANGIPARGSITFGEFEVREGTNKRQQVYFGKALVEAYRAEKTDKWIGITIQKSAWQPYEEEKPGIVAAFESEGVWLLRHDGVLLLNPLVKLRSWYPSAQMGEVDKPYGSWNAPEFPNDISALKYLDGEAQRHAGLGDFTGEVAIKYHTTVAFLKKVLGINAYRWGLQAHKDL